MLSKPSPLVVLWTVETVGARTRRRTSPATRRQRGAGARRPSPHGHGILRDSTPIAFPEAPITLRNYFGRDIKLRHLRLLVAIEDAGQLSKAASLLHLTQPALSKALSDIERGVGHPLFERTPRGLVANARGAVMIRAARRVLEELDRVGAELREFVEHPTRSLVVGAMPTASASFLGQAIAMLHRRDPTVSVRTVDGITGALLPALALERLQLVVGARLRESLPAKLRAHWLFDDPMCLVVAAGHPLARRRAPAWADCVGHPWVLPTPGHPVRSAFDAACKREGLAPPAATLDGLEIGLVLALLRHANAVNLMPARLAMQLQREGQVRILQGDSAQRLSIHLATTAFVHVDHEQHPDVQALLSCLRRVVSGAPVVGTGA